MRGLHDKVAVVTGATQSMGETIARRLAAEGRSVVGLGRSAERGTRWPRGHGQGADDEYGL